MRPCEGVEPGCGSCRFRRPLPEPDPAGYPLYCRRFGEGVAPEDWCDWYECGAPAPHPGAGGGDD